MPERQAGGAGRWRTEHYISYPVTQGRTSRQAHADFPAGTYERELGKEGFFGPATHMYHSHPPTGWIDWEGPLRPRCFDLNRLADGTASPWDAALWSAQRQRQAPLLAGADADGPPRAQRRRRSADLRPRGRGRPVLRLRPPRVPEPATTSSCRAAPCGGSSARPPVSALLIEATGGRLMLPDKGLVGRHAIFDPAMLDVPQIDEAFLGQQGEAATRGPDQAPRCDQHRDLPVQSARCGRLVGRSRGLRGSTSATSGR